MLLFSSKNLSSLLGKEYIFPDNDFLNCLFKNEDFYSSFCAQSRVGTLLYDPIIKFEFLRDMYVPAEAVRREEFLKLDLFAEIETQSIFMKLYNNALIASKIIAMYNTSHHARQAAPSFSDLYLAARLMMNNPQNHLLITGNHKDFPKCLFDVEETILAYNEGEDNDTVLKFYTIKFNQSSFDREYAQLKKLYQ